MRGIDRRIQALEEQYRGREPEASDSSHARERLREILNKYAALRRGDLPEEERPEVKAEVESIRERIHERLEELRGGGRSKSPDAAT